MKKSAKKTASKKPVEKTTTEESTDKNFPGYPYYPVSDDIMNSSEEKIGLDIENPEAPLEKTPDENNNVESSLPENDEVRIMPGTTADITPQDLNDLGDVNLNMDSGDDEDLKQRVYPVDMEGKDLIVPGAELDDENEDIGEEDEENNIYSHSDN
jgi:hypothetical protein